MNDQSRAVRAAPLAGERFEVTPAGLDDAEYAWWQEFSEIEERYCWVQTGPIQRTIRGAYVREIARRIAPGSSVLELGCGTGWLSLQIAEACSAQVIGVDFSAEQIRRANEAARASTGAARVQFHQLRDPGRDLAALGPFDVLLIHGVLHHLSCAEIRELLGGFCRDLGRPGARMFIFEPVVYPVSREPQAQNRIDRLVDRLILLPMLGQRSGIRKRCPEEVRVQDWISRRDQGIKPRGPSPKEMPFRPGELEALLDPFVEVHSVRHVLAFSYHVAKNLLLLQLSYPCLAAILLKVYLPLASRIERSMLARGAWPSRLPVFDLFEASVRREFSLPDSKVGSGQ